MNVNEHPQRTIWPTADNTAVEIIDQTKLPHEFVTVRLESMRDAERAIREIQVHGAPLIGATAANPNLVVIRRCSQKISPYIFAICVVVILCSRLHMKQEANATMFHGEAPSHHEEK